jgi:hypothetical protein
MLPTTLCLQFYKGDGYKFTPFSFTAVLSVKDEDDK